MPATNDPAPPAPRPRDGDATRATILAAARAAFQDKGYARTSLREVARQAGVQPSLIVHFYGSKAGLLAATVDWPFDTDVVIGRVLALGPEHIGERLADVFLETWETEGRPNTVLALLHAAGDSPETIRLMREFFTATIVTPILQAIDVDRAELRASLMSSYLLGLHVGRYLLTFDALTAADSNVLRQALASTLQHLCTGPLWPDTAPSGGGHSRGDAPEVR